MRYHKHKSAFCGKNACLHDPETTAKKRYTSKVKTAPHWGAYHKDYHYWYQNCNRGKLTAAQFAAWKKEASRRRDFVDKGVQPLEDYEAWLLQCREQIQTITDQTANRFWEK